VFPCLPICMAGFLLSRRSKVRVTESPDFLGIDFDYGYTHSYNKARTGGYRCSVAGNPRDGSGHYGHEGCILVSSDPTLWGWPLQPLDYVR